MPVRLGSALRKVYTPSNDGAINLDNTITPYMNGGYFAIVIMRSTIYYNK